MLPHAAPETLEPLAPPPSRARLWAGWILSALISLFLLSGAVNAFRSAPMVVRGTAHLGYSPAVLSTMGVLELVCPVLFLIPQTSFFGAVLLTAFFGGATASHVRIGEAAWVGPVLFGILTWVALCLRSPALERLILRRRSA